MRHKMLGTTVLWICLYMRNRQCTTSDVVNDRLVGWRSQYKYGCIRNERSGVDSYPVTQ